MAARPFATLPIQTAKQANFRSDFWFMDVKARRATPLDVGGRSSVLFKAAVRPSFVLPAKDKVTCRIVFKSRLNGALTLLWMAGNPPPPAVAERRNTIMANTRSAKKMVNKIASRTAVNQARRSRVRSFVRKVEEAIASGDYAGAKNAHQEAERELMRASTKGVLHKKTSARKVSRLAQRVKALSAKA